MAKVGHPSSVFFAIASSRHRHLGSIFEPISNLPALSPSVPPSLPPQILFLPSLSFPRPQLPPPRARTRSVPSSLSLSPSLFLHSLDGWSIGHMRGRGALRARETASRRDMYRLTTTLPGALAWSGLAWTGVPQFTSSIPNYAVYQQVLGRERFIAFLFFGKIFTRHELTEYRT